MRKRQPRGCKIVKKFKEWRGTALMKKLKRFFASILCICMIITSCPDLLAWAAGDTAVVKPVTYRLTANSLSKMVRKAELEKTEENGLCKLKLPKGFNKTLGKTKLHVYLQPDEDNLVFVFENKADKRQGAALIVDNRKSDIFAIPTKAEIYEELGYEYASDSNADEDEIDSEGLLGDAFQDLEAEIVDDAATGSDNNADEKYDYLEGYATHTILNNKKHTAGVAFTVSLDELGIDSLGELLPEEKDEDEIIATDSNAEETVPSVPEKIPTVIPPEVIEATPSDAIPVTVATPSNVAKTFIAEVGGVTIRAHAEAGVLPETATFHVIELKETGDTADAFKEACKTLDEDEDTEYDGVMAYDLHFLDENKNEIEPDGEVQITMEVSQKALPAEADPTTIEVKHLAEEGDSLKVQTVADTADKAEGTVEVKEDVLATSEEEKAAETKVEKNTTVVAAEFNVGSFSYFAITYKKQSYVNAYIIDNNTKNEITLKNTTGALQFNSKYWPTDFGAGWESPKYENGGSEKRENKWISMEAIAATFGGITEGYTYINTTTKRQNGDVIKWICYNSYNSTWYYSSEPNKPDNPKGRYDRFNEKHGKHTLVSPNNNIYMNYSQNPDDNSTINDEIKSKGCLTAPYGLATGVTYKWYRSDNGEVWTPVERKKISGASYNIENDSAGTHLYPAYDLSTDDSIRRWYKVEVYLNGSLERSYTEKQVPYYAALQNGSFENPRTEDINPGGNFTFPNGTTGLVWKTTGTDEEIEIVNKDHGNAHNCNTAADGDQYAELNAEETGALYQDVLTMPGMTLYWQLYHRARSTTKRDKMSLVIAPLTDEVEKTVTQAGLETLIGKIRRKESGYTKAEGFELQDMSSSNTWTRYNGDYQTSSKQYLTRFFFVAGETGSGIKSVGNLLDAIVFSRYIPAPDPGEGNITVRKYTDGILEQDLQYYKVDVILQQCGSSTSIKQTIEFQHNKTGEVTFRGLKEGNGQYGKYFWLTETPRWINDEMITKYGEPESQKILITNSTNNPDEKDWRDYNVKGSMEGYPNGNEDRWIMIQDGETVYVNLKNTYKSQYIPLTISKKVEGNMGNTDQEFEFTVEITDPSGNKVSLAGISYGGDKTISSENKIFLKSNESIEITQKIPYGSKVAITETSNDGYTPYYQVDGGDHIEGNSCEIASLTDTTRVDFTNERSVIIPTGLFDNGHPTGWLYLMAAVAGCFAFGFYRRRKKKLENGEEYL